MAFFDPTEQKLCVRVVYDGVAGAGKTTNLVQLASLFGAQGTRSLEVHSPHETGGKTLSFDWMDIPAGVVAGLPLHCQVVSVPGEVALTPRRVHLLASADVVVYVSDSRPAALERARRGLEVVRAALRDRPDEVPIVLQANKQDAADAVEGADLSTALGLGNGSFDGRGGAPVYVEAIARSGVGVVDTFVAAVRTLSRVLNARSEQGDLRLEVKRGETRAELLAQLEATPIEADGAAEAFLEAAQDAYLAGGDAQRTDPRDSRGSANVLPSPAFPLATAPTGLVWPADRGRAMLHTLAERNDWPTRPRMSRDGVVRHAAFGWVLETRVSRRFETIEGARHALVRFARAFARLGNLVPETTLVAQAAADGTFWIWTVRPEMPSVLEELQQSRSDAEVVSVLESYGVALADAARASLRHGLDLELEASAFGVDGRAIRYLGAVRSGAALTRISAAIALAIASLGTDPNGERSRTVLAAFERANGPRLARPEPLSSTMVRAAKGIGDAREREEACDP